MERDKFQGLVLPPLTEAEFNCLKQRTKDVLREKGALDERIKPLIEAIDSIAVITPVWSCSGHSEDEDGPNDLNKTKMYFCIAFSPFCQESLKNKITDSISKIMKLNSTVPSKGEFETVVGYNNLLWIFNDSPRTVYQVLNLAVIFDRNETNFRKVKHLINALRLEFKLLQN